MLASKPVNKTQAQMATIALFQSLKSVILLALCLTLYYNQYHTIILTIPTIPFIFYTFIALRQNAFVTVWVYFRRVYKYRKVHGFFEQIEPDEAKFNWKGYWSKYTSSLRSKRMENTALVTEQTEEQQKTRMNTQIYIPAPKERQDQALNEKLQYSKKDVNAQSYDQQYLKTRQKYKGSLKIVKKSMEEVTSLCQKFEVVYIEKVKELLAQNEKNIAEIKAQLQKHYLIRVLENESGEKSLKLINVSMDDAISRIHSFISKRCLPWGERMDWDPVKTKAHHRKIQQLSIQRKSIDQALAPYYLLNHQRRTKHTIALKAQIQSNILGVELLNTVAQLYNRQAKKACMDPKNLLYKEASTHLGLQIIQSRVGNRLHADLLIRRPEEKDQLMVCPAGPSNLWVLIALAYLIAKQNL